MKTYLFALLLLLVGPTIKAQTPHEWEKLYDEIMASQDDDQQREEIFETLANLEQNPINLNKATKEDLEQFPFLTAEQIEEILYYLYRYHDMLTLSELMLIESLDAPRRELLSHFLYLKIEEPPKKYPTPKQILQRGTNKIIFNTKIPFYNRQGDHNGYLGYKYAHTLRYDFHYRENFRAGFLGSQDPGEPFFAGQNAHGYDHYSFYLALRHLKCIDRLILGRYRVSIGHGLIINSSFSLGKIAALTSLARPMNTITPYASRSPARYLQGTAITIKILQNTKLSTFASHRSIDATLNKDGTIKNILRTGYHRTPKEMERKNNATQTTIGTNLNWEYNATHLGLTTLLTRYSKPLSPDLTKAYNHDAPAGKTFLNLSLDYSCNRARWGITGETAIGKNNAIATINSISLRPSDILSLLAIQRYYAHNYIAPQAESLRAATRIQNESGILLGLTYDLGHPLTLSFYTDYAYFSHPLRRAHTASHALDNMLTISSILSPFTITARYRIKIIQKDAPKTQIITTETTHRARLSLTYSANQWSTRTQINLVATNLPTTSHGYMITQNIQCTPIPPLSLNADIAYFHTSNFATRIYTYERGPLYAFNFPSFFGKGLHFTLLANVTLTPTLSILGKLSSTKYFDRTHISSGLQQINHSSKTDLELQLSYKF